MNVPGEMKTIIPIIIVVIIIYNVVDVDIKAPKCTNFETGWGRWVTHLTITICCLVPQFVRTIVHGDVRHWSLEFKLKHVSLQEDKRRRIKENSKETSRSYNSPNMCKKRNKGKCCQF